MSGEDSALTAAKKGKDTSLWLSIESLKNNEADAIVSAGNTGALFVIAKFNLNREKQAILDLNTGIDYLPYDSTKSLKHKSYFNRCLVKTSPLSFKISLLEFVVLRS